MVKNQKFGQKFVQKFVKKFVEKFVKKFVPKFVQKFVPKFGQKFVEISGPNLNEKLNIRIKLNLWSKMENEIFDKFLDGKIDSTEHPIFNSLFSFSIFVGARPDTKPF